MLFRGVVFVGQGKMTSALHKHGDVAAPRKSANGDKSLVIHEDV